jgi:CubicO group peptidase (beta-lactamase class C family)
MNAKLKSVLILTLLVGLVLVPRLPVKADAPLDTAVLDAYLIKQVRENRIPGLAAAVVQGGRLVFLKGYGVDPQAQFLLGSTTKSFTALALMQLVEAGKLDLDAPVQNYLPWFRVADPQASARITLRHLLNQTSGLSAPLDPSAGRFYPTLEDQVRALSDARLNAEPGASYQYFNQNYRVLGLLIEKASGQTYADYLRSHIFEPLGMASTVADPADAPRMAPGYTQVFSFPVRFYQPFHADALPSGYLISTAGDSARYLTALMNGGELDGRRVISPASLEAMFSPPAGVKSTYGMGWMALDDPEIGGKAYYHAGGLECFASQFLMLPGRDLGLVLLYNQNSLFPMLTEQEQILQGAAQALVGETPAQGGTVWPGLALLGVALLDLLNHVRLFAGLKRLAGARRAVWVWLRVIALELAFPIALLLFAPTLIASALGETGGWVDFFSVLPDLCGWMLVGSCLALLRGLIGLAILVRRVPARQVAISLP